MSENQKDSSGKVIVIGLDGATFDLLDPLIKLGKMPNLAWVIKHGSRSKLRSTIPPVTGPSWVSFMTGKKPENHGVFDFVVPIANKIKRQVISHKHIRSQTIWNILTEQNKKIGSLNVPVTYPAPKVNGFMVSGMLTPSLDEGLTSPPELFHELMEHVPGYVLDVWWQKYGGNSVKKFLEELINCSKQREKALLYLMKNKPWDFFMVVFVGTDRIQHFLWKEIMSALTLAPKNRDEQEINDLVFAFFEQIDEMIGQVTALMGDHTKLLIMSDHGFGNLAQKLHINRWLEEQEWFKLDRQGFDGLRKKAKLKFLLQQIVMKVDYWDLRKKLLAKYRKFNKRSEGYNFLDYVDWTQTRAFSVSNTEQGIYINLKGRESCGIVAPGEEYEQLRDEIISRLKTIKDPETGKPLVSQVNKREEVYHGKYTEKAPDIIFFLKEGEYVADVQPLDCLFQKAGWKTGTGTHRMDGILIGYGDGIKADHQFEGAEIIDLAPTILHAMGLPIPSDMDGRVLTELFNQEFSRKHQTHYDTTAETDQKSTESEVYSEEEASVIEERLRSLGYMD